MNQAKVTPTRPKSWKSSEWPQEKRPDTARKSPVKLNTTGDKALSERTANVTTINGRECGSINRLIIASTAMTIAGAVTLVGLEYPRAKL